MKSYMSLLQGCYEGINNPDLFPKKEKDDAGQDVVVESYCNLFVDSVAKKMGCAELSNKTADDMIDYMSAAPNWTEIPLDKAQWMASVGSLVIAAEKADPHGHVCVIIPGIGVRSIHWAISSPVCANVGKDVFIGKSLSFAFKQIPKLYVWRPSL